MNKPEMTQQPAARCLEAGLTPQTMATSTKLLKYPTVTWMISLLILGNAINRHTHFYTGLNDFLVKELNPSSFSLSLSK
jgi:hypothetical protein